MTRTRATTFHPACLLLAVWLGCPSPALSGSVPGGGPLPTVAGDRLWLVPSAVRAAGVGGSLYVSDLSIFNPHPTQEMGVSLAFLSYSGSTTELEWHSFRIDPQKTLTFSDLLQTVFGASSTVGSILVRCDTAAADPVLHTRIINTILGDPGRGTIGLATPVPRLQQLIQKSTPEVGRTIAGLQEDSSYRTNLALCNPTETPATVRVTLSSRLGAKLGEKVVALFPYGYTQLNRVIPSLGGSVEPGDQPDSVVVEVMEGGSIYSYANLVDNTSSDSAVLTPFLSPGTKALMPGAVRMTDSGALLTTDLLVYNPSASARSVDVIYTYADLSDPNRRLTVKRQLTLAPRQTFAGTDFITSLMGLEPAQKYVNGLVDVRVSPGSGQEPVLAWAVRKRQGPQGATHFQITGYSENDGISVATPDRKRLFMTGLSSGAGYASSVALFLVDGNPDSFANAFLNIFEGSGKLLKTVPITLSSQQPYVEKGDAELFADVTGDKSRLSLVLDGLTGTGTVAGFATVTDTRSGDGFMAVGTAAPSCVVGSAPSLVQPLEAATGVVTSPALSWTPGSAAFRYDVYLDTANPPRSIVTADIAAISYTPSNLQPSTRYYWKVVAKGDPLCDPVFTASSEVRSFTTQESCTQPGAFSLTSPAAGAAGIPGATTLAWSAATGAGSYSVYFGPANPPPFLGAGVQATTFSVAGLVPGATYYWNVVAHARCDPAKTVSTAVRSFAVAGICKAPGPFSLTYPAVGASVPAAFTFSWAESENAGSYDLYLGSEADPPLYQSGLSRTVAAVSSLRPGHTYFWKVVARTSCSEGLQTVSAVRSFTVSGTCATPGTPSILFAPPNAGVGQTYVVAWSEPQNLGAGGGYVIERSLSPAFSPLVDSQLTSMTSSSFVASREGRIYHRVLAISGCDPAKVSAASDPKSTNVIAASPNVVFTVQPEAIVMPVGDNLDAQKTRFSVENITASPVQVLIGRQELSSVPFFNIVDPQGGDAAFLTLEPHKPKTFEIRFSGPPTSKEGSFQGLIFVASVGQGLSVTPYAFVGLRVGGTSGVTPEFSVNGLATEYTFFPGLSGDDSNRPPIEVQIRNPGSTSMDLGAEIGPELWLVPEPGWNATPIPAGASRTVRLYTKRVRAPNGSALPRYTYLKVRTRDGRTARLLVQDNDAPILGEGRPALGRDVPSFIVPSAASAKSRIENLFISRLRLSNSGMEPVQAEIYLTAPEKDGFESFKNATVIVPPCDVVNLTDPLVQLFGLSRPAVGTVEVRVPREKAGYLSVTSGVDVPSTTGGTFGFQMPVVSRGSGARIGNPYEISGITATTDYRTNLILTETTGIEATEVRLTLFDKAGTRLSDRTLVVPRYGMVQVSGVVAALAGGDAQEAASLEIDVLSGGGSVFGVVTVIDNRNDDAVTYLGRPIYPETPGFLSLRGKKPVWAKASGSQKAIVPSIVSGYTQALPGSGSPYMFRSLMGFKAPASQAASFTLTYHDMAKDPDNAEKRTRTVDVPRRSTVEYQNVIEELFGVAAGQNSQGPVFVEVTGSGTVYTKVFSTVEGKGSFGDAFPVIPIVSEGLTGGVSRRLLEIDGLEQAMVETSPGQWSERVRGTRSNLILNEVLGKPVTIRVSLYEAGNRSVPIAEKDLEVKPLGRVQLNTVFSSLGLNDETRRKDRLNVKCVVQALEGEGMVSAVVTTIDNQTADTRNGQMLPAGAGTGTGAAPIGF